MTPPIWVAGRRAAKTRPGRASFRAGSVFALLVALAAFAGPALAQDPGVAVDNQRGRSDETRLGTILIYNLVSSSETDPLAEDTRLTLTNASATDPAAVRLFFVAGTGSVTSSGLCLTPNQTASFLASEIRPGVRGFVIATAVDPVTGLCINHNFLSGQAHVWLASGFRGTLEAVGVPAIPPNPMPCVVSTDGSLMAFFFDGLSLAGSYNRMPRVLHLLDVPSPDDRQALLVVNRIGGNLSTGSASLGNLFGVLHDEAGHAHGFSIAGGSQIVGTLSDAFPATAPPLSSVLPAGHTGWLRLFSQSDIAISGAVLFAGPAPEIPEPTDTRDPGLPIPLAAPFATGGGNLTPSTLTSAGVVVLPILPPGCP